MTGRATGRRLLRLALWAAALGLLITLPLRDQQRISVELWFAALATWILFGLATDLLKVSPADRRPTAGLIPVLARRARPATRPDDDQLTGHRYLEALVMQATGNERSHARRLRPRLQALVDHHLQHHGGIDRGAEPTEAHLIQQQLLGDTAWLIDPAVTDRRPTLEELDRFLQRLNDATGISYGERR